MGCDGNKGWNKNSVILSGRCGRGRFYRGVKRAKAEMGTGDS